MKRAELKEILSQDCEESRRYYRQYPTLYRDLLLWDDYLSLIREKRRAKIHAPKTRAREEAMGHYSASDKTFYAIRGRLKDLCEDVSD